MLHNSSLHPLLESHLEFKSIKWGLERIIEADRLLHSPSKQFASVHVAGTNGKGSVATKIARALETTGKKVGLFTSPHIESYRERVQVNGRLIPEERVDVILNKILSSTPEMCLSYFELLTLLAFCHFAEEKVDVAVLETGMGGRLDATNIVEPVLSIITSIDFDHTAHLGKSLETIAFEKAGILKPGVSALLGPHVKPQAVFKEVAEKLKCPLFDVSGDFEHYDLENSAIAKKALSLLPFPLENKSIMIGLSAVPPCRFEVVSEKDPLVILDVAHNPNGLARTFERMQWAYPSKKVYVLAGFCEDKAIEESLNFLEKQAEKLYLTHTDHPRLLSLGDADFERVFQEAYLEAQKNEGILLVCGTFFIMSAAKKAVSKALLEKGDD
ncbi:MAG: Dihydrofolate synthase/folylpolyglutamate synthase [Chlamydiales bacterium]|nr:Dihydrofolate synthase/folylpolyglutamate synthase [Chlamydiales bacterium]